MKSARYGSVPALAETDRREQATMRVCEALARGDRNIGEIQDPFGKPYTAYWFDDAVYFEPQSQWDEAHDLDFSLGRPMDRETFEKRIAAGERIVGLTLR